MLVSFLVVSTSGPVHRSGGRMSKSEIRKQNSQIILEEGDSFNEVDDRSNVGKLAADKRVVRGQMISSNMNRQSNEPVYSPDMLDDGKCNKLFYGSKAASSYCKKGKYKITSLPNKILDFDITLIQEI